jgi:hypothetical protein
MLLSLTALYAQTGVSKHIVWHTGDTLTCYTIDELRKIANTTVYANECDTLLKISNAQIENYKLANSILNQAISEKNSIIQEKDTIINLKEDIITGKDNEITGLRNILKTNNNKLKWMRIGWISTTGILTYIILRK